MDRSIKAIPKKRGRPATGKAPLVALRMPPRLIEQIDMWAEYQKTGRSDAIRRLVELGLATATRRSKK
jgi:metal-responsive CopG/Arc/MetJ family transcriptional regulator